MGHLMSVLMGFAKGFLQDLRSASVEEIALVLAKHIFLRALKDVPPHDVITAIKENRNLWNEFNERDDWLKLGEQFKDRILENINRVTPELIMRYMYDSPEPHRSQVEIIINTAGGTDWFVGQVNFIKEKIKEYYRGV